jgi:hypothetical protein
MTMILEMEIAYAAACLFMPFYAGVDKRRTDGGAFYKHL